MIEFRMPSLGASMESGTLVEWKIKPGDTVKAGDIVAVVETEKAALDVEIFDAGQVQELLVAPGEKVPVGTVLATLRANTEQGEQAAPQAIPGPRVEEAAAPSLPTPSPAPLMPASTSIPSLQRKRISPAARKRASELGIDPGQLGQGSGPSGALTLRDVEAAARSEPVRRREQVMHAMGAAMAQSKREIPHYYLSSDIEVGRAQQWLGVENARLPANERMLFAALLYKAVALSLLRVPELNGHYRAGAFAPADGIHLGIAISLRHGGTLAPAIRDVDKKSLGELMSALSDLTQRTRAGSLRSSELTDPTATVTSLGDQGPDLVVGVIHPPQVAIIGFGASRLRPWVHEGLVVARPVITATLSADHRASEGRQGARFLESLRDHLNNPEQL